MKENNTEYKSNSKKKSIKFNSSKIIPNNSNIKIVENETLSSIENIFQKETLSVKRSVKSDVKLPNCTKQSTMVLENEDEYSPDINFDMNAITINYTTNPNPNNTCEQYDTCCFRSESSAYDKADPKDFISELIVEMMKEERENPNPDSNTRIKQLKSSSDEILETLKNKSFGKLDFFKELHKRNSIETEETLESLDESPNPRLKQNFNSSVQKNIAKNTLLSISTNLSASNKDALVIKSGESYSNSNSNSNSNSIANRNPNTIGTITNFPLPQNQYLSPQLQPTRNRNFNTITMNNPNSNNPGIYDYNNTTTTNLNSNSSNINNKNLNGNVNVINNNISNNKVNINKNREENMLKLQAKMNESDSTNLIKKKFNPLQNFRPVKIKQSQEVLNTPQLSHVIPVEIVDGKRFSGISSITSKPNSDKTIHLVSSNLDKVEDELLKQFDRTVDEGGLKISMDTYLSFKGKFSVIATTQIGSRKLQKSMDSTSTSVLNLVAEEVSYFIFYFK